MIEGLATPCVAPTIQTTQTDPSPSQDSESPPPLRSLTDNVFGLAVLWEEARRAAESSHAVASYDRATQNPARREILFFLD